MRVVVTVIYVVMAAWLLVAAGLRAALLLAAGSPLGPLPFISGAIAVVALIAVLAANAELRQRR